MFMLKSESVDFHVDFVQLITEKQRADAQVVKVSFGWARHALFLIVHLKRRD